MACTVAFMDIKSASKAHNTEHKVDDRTLTTEYYEPAAIPSSASPQTTTSPYSTSPGSTRFPNGHSSSDEHGPFAERFYERNNSRVADGEFIRRGGGGYHDTNRSRTRDRGFRNGPYNVVMDRGSHRTLNNSWSYDSGGGSGGGASTGGRYNSQNETGYTAAAATTTAAAAVAEGGGTERRGTSDQSTKKKTKSRSGSRSPSPSGSTSSRSPSRSRSRSSSSSSSSSTSRTSSTSTPKSRRTAANSHLAHSDDRRPLAICVRNLPLRSSDTSLKDGLYHEYKKHGKVTSVKVVGQNSERHAIVCFKKPEDVEKALEVSYDKLFFGCKIEVAPYQGFDVEDNDLRPYEADIDEFHPKATRTLFIGNLEKDTTASDLRKHFDQFGEIIEIDIKNQGNVSLYAFCQYSDIVSVVKAIRKMDGEHLGNNRIKLGFGKSMPTNVVWVDGIVENVNEKYLRMQFDPFGPISKVSIDRDRGQALIFYEQMVGAQSAVSKMRGYSLKGNKIQVDFASRECQQSFYEHLEKQTPAVIERVEERRDSTSRSFDSSRFARYDTPTRPRTSSYSSRSSIAASQVASAIPSPGTPGSVTPRATGSKPRIAGRFNDYYEGGDVNDRHFRNYDEYSQGSAASQDDPYDPDYNNHESPMNVDVIEPRATTATIIDHSTSVPYAPPDIRNLQKERFHLLEQLEDCPSSGDEHLVSKKRLKLDLSDNTIGTEVIIEANRDHRKVVEVRKLSDVALKHHSRRASADNKHSRDSVHERSNYIPHGICKRRKTGGSDSGSRSHHYDHSGSESIGGSRPGTPLCDERPENFPPSEPRRVPRERNGPLSLPLPRFASQVPPRGSISIAGIKGQKDVVVSSPPPAVTSPRISIPKPTSPVHVPPPASPPPRPPSLSSNSSDSENPPSPSLDERIKSLDEKYEKWSGSRALSAAGGDALAKLDATREKFRLRHKLLDFDLKEVQPSEIVKSVMAKRSVFDEDLKRLENVGEKYEPKDFSLFPRAASIIQSTAIAVPPIAASSIKITSPSLQMSMLSPRSSGSNMIPAKGLQYPFPSHPPIQPTTPTLLQTPPATPSIASPNPQIQTASTTTRSTNHGENRLKSCASASSDNRLSSKVNVNRSAVLNNSAPIKSSEKNSGNISNDPSALASVGNAIVETKSSRTLNKSEKISNRRDSNNGSPRGDIKPRRNSDIGSRRNSDVGSRRTEDLDKFSENVAENDRKSERGKSEERKREQQKEKQRLENEMLERERLEKEQQEKERLEKERLEREKQEREKELEKERLLKEKHERERQERIRQEKEHEKREQEKLKREREEQERLRREREEAEREKLIQEERQRKEKEETEKKERELKEKIAEEERQIRKERQAKKERHEAEKLEKDRRREEEKKHKEDNHEKRKDDYRNRENHEVKHKDNNVNEKSNHEHKYIKQSSKEEKDKSIHEIFRKNDSHDRNNSEKYMKHTDKDSDYRRKESIKENRDNNTHEKLKDAEARHISMELDKPKSDTLKIKESNSTPASLGIKRRRSSQDNFDHSSEAKKPKLHSDHKKISERRDSKDSTRSDEKIKPKLKTSRSLEDKPSFPLEKSNFLREYSEEKRKEKDKDRDDKHRNKQKFEKQNSKSKSREKDLRESPTAITSKELTDKDFLARLELRSTDDVDMQKEKRPDTKEKRRYDLTDTDSEKRDKDDKARRKEKMCEKSRSREDQCSRSFEEKNKLQKKERIRKPTINSSDATDSDEPRKHSIFDIVDDEPAYISMYDKVKARSCKNMQKQEEEKRQEKIKAKFSQLKQSRAKREEKKRSTSWDDDDSDSDTERNDKSDSKSRRHKMLIVSSDDDFSDFGKSHKKRGVFTDSDSDRNKQHKNELTEPSDDDMIERKSSKSSRYVNETSDDDYKNPIKPDIFSLSKMEISSYLDLDMFKVKDEFRRSVEKDRKTAKQDNSYDEKDPEVEDSKPPLSEIKSEKINNRHSYPDNSSADDSSEFKKEKLKKHKKKQKRLKHSVSSEDSNKFDSTESHPNDSSEKVKLHDKKKQHTKKDKKRDKSKERERSKKSKRSKSSSKNDFKLDGKMENIFGSLSDSSENGMRDHETSENKMNNSFMKGFNDENIPSRYTDSEGEKDTKCTKTDENDSKEDQRIKKRKERKRKEKERLLQEAAAAAALAEAADHFNEASMDFADMGKQLEANIKDEPVNQNDTPAEKNVKEQKESIFKYYDDALYQDFKKEDKKESREKKKKRKKSKEERKNHHHHHHHHHHDKSKVKSENKKETLIVPKEEPSTPEVQETKTQSQSLPNILDIPSPPQEKVTPRVEIAFSVKSETIDIQISEESPTDHQEQQIQISPISSKEKKRDKFIPGFGPDIDETVHENAVKSISDFDAIKLPECPKIEDVKVEKPEEIPEEKPRAVISQEETEDAVAALLGESFSNEFENHYTEDDISNTIVDDQTTTLVEEPTVQDDEEMRQAVQSLGAEDLDIKPETPQSEHELQIDTDTEEQDEISLRFDQQPKTPDMSELLLPPKTPDIHYRSEESKLTPSPLVIKTTLANIGSPPSLAPITQQPSLVSSAKRNLDKIDVPSKIAPLELPPLIEPTRTIVHPWVTKADEIVSKMETKLSVVNKTTSGNSPKVQQCTLASTPPSIITSSQLRTSVVKISEPSYPPLTAISKQDTIPTKTEIPMTSIPILQVASPALHNLPARSPLQQTSPSSSSQDLSSAGQVKASTSISKIRLPITPVMVSKPLQATTINLPQPKVAFTSEPPKLIPTQDPRPRMIFQNSGMPSFPFNPNQKMLVQTNIPVARGLLLPSRPGHFNYVPSQVAFNASIAEKSNETNKTSTTPISITLGQASPNRIIQMKPQPILISPNSHISPVVNNQKLIKALLPDNPPSLVAISSTSDISTGISHISQINSIAKISNPDTDTKKETSSKDVPIIATPPVETIPSPKPLKEVEDEKLSLQKIDVEPEINSSEEVPKYTEQEEEKHEVKNEEQETKEKLAIETVTDELNQTLKDAMDCENNKQVEDEVEEHKDDEIKSDIKIEDENETKPKLEGECANTKEPEKVEEEKTDSESIVSDISKDCSSADMPIKDLLLDGREDKEDSDYWSPKDVNIDSVIKTLCSADELSNHSNDNISTKEDEQTKEKEVIPPQIASVEIEAIKEVEEDNKESCITKSDTETLDDSVEDDDKEVVSRVATRRGGRGRGRKARGGIERGGIQTRRGKVQTKEAVTPTKRNSARGGRAKIERKASKSESETPADIYEFREDEENRPRLILTIKQSNSHSAAVQSAVVKEIPKEPPPVQTPPKSAEVKEKTEDFTQPSGSTNTRKSKRLQEKDIFRTTVDDTIEDVVKNVVTRSSSLATRRSTRQPPPLVKATPETLRKSTRGRRIGRRASEATEETTEEKEKLKPSDEIETFVETPKVEVEKSKEEMTPQVNSTVIDKEENTHPKIPVKENVEKPPIGLKAAVLRRIKGEMGQEPTSLIDPVTGLLTPMRECEENKYIPVPGENKPGIISTANHVSTVVTSTEVKPMQPTVITSSHQSAPLPTVKQQSKPQSLKAHVLSSQAAQAVVTQQFIPSQKQNAVVVSTAPSSISMENKMNTQHSQNLSVNVSLPNYVSSHISPRTNLAVTSSPKPVSTVKLPTSSPSQMYNLITQQMVQMRSSPSATMVSKGVLPNTPIMTQQQSLIKQVPLPKSAMLGKTGHPMHIPGAVPNAVLGKIPPQTVVTNTNRLMPGKNMMEPPKVDVSLSNLMAARGLSSLSPQGQPRHHPQSTIPVSGYEANLHGERGLYNRSRSPPPAHQNSPSPKAETIPHFPPGSVTLRPHDLPPPHYMHPSHVMYQQYLRQSYHFPRSIVPGCIEKPGDGQEGEEAPITSPPLELRISNPVGLSLSSRGAAVPHSLHSPHDRATDSPQIGQVYNMPTARMQHYNLNRYYEPAAEPPPAHRPVTSHSSLAALGSDRPPLSHMAALGAPDRPLVSHLPPERPLGSHLPPDRPLSGHSALTGHLPLGNPERPTSSHLPPDRPMSSHLTPDRLSGISTPDRPVSAHTMTLGAGLGAAGNLMGAVARHIGVDAPTSQRGVQAATPPHASQVPPQAESLNILLKQYPKMWQGLLALKNDQAAVHMYYVSGNNFVADCSLPKNTDGSTPPLRIFQRMRLEPPQVEGVARKMQMEKEHCMLLALPCGMDHMDVLKQSNNLTNGFIHYLQQKQAAGIVNVAAPGTTQPPAYVVHIFPTCSFVEENLRRIAPSLLECVSDIAHLLVVITTV